MTEGGGWQLCVKCLTWTGRFKITPIGVLCVYCDILDDNIPPLQGYPSWYMKPESGIGSRSLYLSEAIIGV